jgi:hypothetical protein
MNESAPIRAAKQHRTWTIFVDTSWNIQCYDRRRLFVVSK